MNKYPWTAIFRNGDMISQYDSFGNENLFKKVLEREKELRCFLIENNSDVYCADLLDGVIRHNNIIVRKLNVEKKPKLVYFRRNIVTISQGSPESKTVIHFIGLNDQVIQVH